MFTKIFAHPPIEDLKFRAPGDQANVHISVWVDSISDISTVTHSFRAFLEVRCQWQLTKEEYEKREKDANWQPSPKPWIHPANVTSVDYYQEIPYGQGCSPTRLVTDSGLAMCAMEWFIAATYSERFELERFPFDVQCLAIDLQCLPYMDFQGVGHDALVRVHAKAFASNEFALKDIQVGHGGPWKQQLRICFNVRRHWQPYFWRVVVVLAMVSLAAPAVFLIDEVSDRLSFLTTLFLTAVAYQYSIAQDLPKLAYLTFIDIYVLFCFIFIGSVFMCVALNAGGKEEHVEDEAPAVLAKEDEARYAKLTVLAWVLFHAVMLVAAIVARVRENRKLKFFENTDDSKHEKYPKNGDVFQDSPGNLADDSGKSASQPLLPAE